MMRSRYRFADPNARRIADEAREPWSRTAAITDPPPGACIGACYNPRMSRPELTKHPMSQDEFGRWVRNRPATDIHHYELLDGQIVMEPPASWPYGAIGARLIARLDRFVEQRSLGLVLDSSQGFDLPSGDTVEPDATFVSKQRWRTEDAQGFLRVVADLVVEILSPSTAKRDKSQKKRIYAENGVGEYWLVDPKRREVTRFVAVAGKFDRGTVYGQAHALESIVLDGLRVPVGSLFPGA